MSASVLQTTARKGAGMNNIAATTLMILMSAVASASAQSDGDSAVRIYGGQPAFALPASPHPVFAAELDAYKGSYDLSDGSVLVLQRIGTQLHAQMNGGKRQALVATGANVFVAKDRAMQLTLAQGDDGQVAGGVLMYAAQAPQQAARYIQLRLLAAAPMPAIKNRSSTNRHGGYSE
jgi:hypothetical protein